jgi:NAD(P)-dependent dehydrogenase (short-subunit alcohol dehydrogenase family)
MARLPLSQAAIAVSGGQSHGTFADEGTFVYITGRRQAELDKVVEFIGSDAKAVRADITNESELDRLYAQVRAEKERPTSSILKCQ